ncbi:hypothetical protein PHYSODRAFT_507251, partial [Phytophthora sojae]
TQYLMPRKWNGSVSVGASMVCSTAQSTTSSWCTKLSSSARSCWDVLQTASMTFSTLLRVEPVTNTPGGVSGATVEPRGSTSDLSRAKASAALMAPASRSRKTRTSSLDPKAFHLEVSTTPPLACACWSNSRTVCCSIRVRGHAFERALLEPRERDRPQLDARNGEARARAHCNRVSVHLLVRWRLGRGWPLPTETRRICATSRVGSRREVTHGRRRQRD